MTSHKFLLRSILGEAFEHLALRNFQPTNQPTDPNPSLTPPTPTLHPFCDPCLMRPHDEQEACLFQEALCDIWTEPAEKNGTPKFQVSSTNTRNVWYGYIYLIFFQLRSIEESRAGACEFMSTTRISVGNLAASENRLKCTSLCVRNVLAIQNHPPKAWMIHPAEVALQPLA